MGEPRAGMANQFPPLHSRCHVEQREAGQRGEGTKRDSSQYLLLRFE